MSGVPPFSAERAKTGIGSTTCRKSPKYYREDSEMASRGMQTSKLVRLLGALAP